MDEGLAPQQREGREVRDEEGDGQKEKGGARDEMVRMRANISRAPGWAARWMKKGRQAMSNMLTIIIMKMPRR